MSNFKWLRSNLFGGLTDQAIVSLGNFGLNVVLARSFNEHDYGVFALILSVVLFLNTLHQAFVTFPLSVHGASAEASRFGYIIAVAVTLTLIETALFFPALGGAAFSTHQAALIPVACLFLLSWQLQEVYRRGLLARARYGAAIANDFARYIVPLAAVMLLGRLLPLTPGSVFMVLSLGSLLTGLGLAPVLLSCGPAAFTHIRDELRGHWHIAAPVLFANILAVLSTQWFLWLLAWSHDLTSSATLGALVNIVAFFSPVMYGMENILVPEIARRRTTLSFQALQALLRRRSLACAALVTPLFVIVMAWPGPVLHLFYGHQRGYAQYTFALRLLALAYMTYLASYILGAALRGYRESGAVFKMQLYPALLGVTLGSWLTLQMGVTGACLAAFLAGLLRASLGYYFVSGLRELTVPDTAAIVVDA